MKRKLSLTINGKSHDLDIEPDVPLLWVIRETIGMTGTTHRFGIPPKLGRDHTLEQVTTTTPNDQGLLLELILQGTTDPAVARQLGSTPELCRLGLDILSWQ